MIVNGIFQRLTESGELKNTRTRFESTGIKEHGKVIWRRINKDGTPSNVFAEQFDPDVPWAVGKWFIKINSADVLRSYPQLKVETEKSKAMTDEEYLEFLNSRYFG